MRPACQHCIEELEKRIVLLEYAILTGKWTCDADGVYRVFDPQGVEVYRRQLDVPRSPFIQSEPSWR